jgi:5-methylcytosine-specific restriction enzyme A
MPRAPKFCGSPGCTGRVVGRAYCDFHAPPAWNGGHGSTRRWRKLRQDVLNEEPVCRDCHQAPSAEAGHIVSRARGGEDARENLKGQCRPCNLAQMHAEREQDRQRAHDVWP